MKYKYIGETAKVFPSIGVTVEPGDEFDAPEDFVAVDVESVGAKSFSSAKPKKHEEVKEEETIEPSAASDTTLGE